MKRYAFTIVFLLCGAGISFAQETKPKIPREVFVTVSEMPEFPGGNETLCRFITDHVKYPKSAVRNKIQGKVIVRFIVEPDGRISDPEVLQSLDPDCDKEALRVVKKMPRWRPGRQNGAFVAVYYQIPFSFKLH